MDSRTTSGAGSRMRRDGQGCLWTSLASKEHIPLARKEHFRRHSLTAYQILLLLCTDIHVSARHRRSALNILEILYAASNPKRASSNTAIKPTSQIHNANPILRHQTFCTTRRASIKSPQISICIIVRITINIIKCTSQIVMRHLTVSNGCVTRCTVWKRWNRPM